MKTHASTPKDAQINLPKLAEHLIEYSLENGAQQARVSVQKRRLVQLKQRDEELEQVREATDNGVSLGLFVDGRYISQRSSDLRWEALQELVRSSVKMARLLSIDPHRKLTDPSLYSPLPPEDLQLLDPHHASLTSEQRRQRARELTAHILGRDQRVISSTGHYSDRFSQTYKMHSNGFAAGEESGFFSLGLSVSVQDPQGRKPSAGFWSGARWQEDLHSPKEVAEFSLERALRRIGQRKMPSGKMTVVVENSAARAVLGHFLRAFSGAALQQNQSFLDGRKGQKIGAAAFTLSDDPLIPRGLGSEYFDNDGLSAKRRLLIEQGVLKDYLIDVYYGRKLDVHPTGGSTSNLVIEPGERDLGAILTDIQNGVYITGFLGGNSDTTRGDFSFGIEGFAIENGELSYPIGEMNLSGNMLDLWSKLIEVGNDPWLWSAVRSPTLVFADQSVSGQ